MELMVIRCKIMCRQHTAIYGLHQVEIWDLMTNKRIEHISHGTSTERIYAFAFQLACT